MAYRKNGLSHNLRHGIVSWNKPILRTDVGFGTGSGVDFMDFLELAIEIIFFIFQCQNRFLFCETSTRYVILNGTKPSPKNRGSIPH
jgi:hypothetical protein